MPRMTNEEALDILERQIECDNDNCPEPGMSCSECPYSVDAIDYARARKMAIEALSKQCASTEQADKKLFGHGYWLFPGEVFISHNVLNEVLDTITKSINTEQRKIDSTLVKTSTNDEAIRTDDHIADSDKMVDQFHDTTKKTEDVPDANVGSKFKPGGNPGNLGENPGIILCKDCRYRDPEDKKCDHGHGIVWQLPRPDDWFCADGKA